MNEQKKLDKKLKIGAKMAFITNIVSIIISIIIFIISIAAFEWIFSQFQEENTIENFKTIMRVILIIFTLVSITLNGIIIWLSKNVLNGKGKYKITAAVFCFILGGLSIITMFGGGAIIVGSLVFGGLNIAAGVLLILGKYIEESTSINNIEKNSIINSDI